MLSCRDLDLRPDEVPAAAAKADIVVTHHDERHDPFGGGRLRRRPLLREPLDVVLPPGHPLADRPDVHVTDLADEDWISVEVEWPVDDVLTSLALVSGTTPRIVQRTNDFSVTEELVADGHGIALLPRYSTDHRAGIRLALRPLAGVRAARLVHAVARPETAQRPAVRLVLDELVAAADAVRLGAPLTGGGDARYAATEGTLYSGVPTLWSGIVEDPAAGVGQRATAGVAVRADRRTRPDTPIRRNGGRARAQ